MAKKKTTPRAKSPTDQEPALLSAVFADPENDALRLAYADWLEKHGQPDRAEFIRLQIERAPLPYPEGYFPSARETALLSAHCREWLGSLPEWLHPRFGFHRGFPERARYVEMADFLRWDASIWQLAPLIDLKFTDYPAVAGEYRPPEEKEAMLRALAAKPELAHLRILSLHESGTTVADLEIILASPHLVRLHTLDLGASFDGPEIARVLDCLARLPGLRSLNLEANCIGDEEIAPLLASPVLPRLTSLCLGNSNIGDPGVELLAASPLVSKLDRLGLHCNSFGDRGARALAASPYLGQLKDLSLMANEISAEGQAALRERFGSRAIFEIKC